MVLLLGMVLIRAQWMRRSGIEAVHFGKTDKTDFLIPPFAFFYFYVIFAAAFHLPLISRRQFFQCGLVSWIGLVFCVSGLLLLFVTLVSFGRSFRVGIDADSPDRLVTTGVFAISRNPIYVAFGFVLLGEFLLFSNWILLAYLVAGVWLFNRQVLREEEFLKRHYGQEYVAYFFRVRRYL